MIMGGRHPSGSVEIVKFAFAGSTETASTKPIAALARSWGGDLTCLPQGGAEIVTLMETPVSEALDATNRDQPFRR